MNERSLRVQHTGLPVAAQGPADTVTRPVCSVRSSFNALNTHALKTNYKDPSRLHEPTLTCLPLPPMTALKYHLISLGSSFGAGPGIKPLANRSANRSTLNYPSVLARLIGSTHSDQTVSGATLLNIITTPQTAFFTTFEPQIQSVTANADFVTITAGGNDMGYIGGMMKDALMAREDVLSQSIQWVLSWFHKDEEVSVPTEDELVGRMGDVIDAVRARAPEAIIILVEYLTVIGNDATYHAQSCPFTDEQLATYRSHAKQLQRVYAGAAEHREGVRLIPIAEKSMGHGLGSDEPWVTGFSLGMLTGGETAFHPNEKGMQAVAEIIYEDMNGAGLV
jgi:lysophospholipase L1-like esterase